jgi:hypothetical protein
MFAAIVAVSRVPRSIRSSPRAGRGSSLYCADCKGTYHFCVRRRVRYPGAYQVGPDPSSLDTVDNLSWTPVILTDSFVKKVPR